jgi:carbonic anhydrase/acetyltransferase-like protein (isoleucine patch superfamily)
MSIPVKLLPMTLYALGDIEPQIDPDAFVHPDCTIIGNVVIGAGSTIWPQAVLRGDQSRIVVGARTSVQDGAVLHCTRELETIVGDDCTIGHLAHLEGCTVENGSLIGTGSIVLHRAIVRTGALVGAGAVVPNGMEVPSGAMALGVPARLREGAVQPEQVTFPAQEYVRNCARFRAELRRID